MKVDSDKWKDERNRLSPRFLTRDKDADLRKQVALLESLGVIEKSEYSQVHLLVRKPDNSWRLCNDFKTLNDATESLETWPLQNIPIMVDRHWVWFFPVCPSCPILPGLNLSFHA